MRVPKIAEEALVQGNSQSQQQLPTVEMHVLLLTGVKTVPNATRRIVQWTAPGNGLIFLTAALSVEAGLAAESTLSQCMQRMVVRQARVRRAMEAVRRRIATLSLAHRTAQERGLISQTALLSAEADLAAVNSLLQCMRRTVVRQALVRRAMEAVRRRIATFSHARC